MKNFGDTLARSVALRIGAPVASASELSAMGVDDRSEGMSVLVTADTDGNPRSYFWSDASTATAAAGLVIAATDAPSAGRWLVKSSASGGSSITDWKESVKAATATALAAYTRTANVLLANANGALGTIDGVTVAVGSRVLVKDGAAGADNGIYTIDAMGAGGSKWQMTRSSDADVSAKVTSGMAVEVEGGTVNGGRIFVLSTSGAITLNSTSLTFSLPAGLVQIGGDLSGTPGAPVVATVNGQAVMTHAARGVVTANIADLTAFTVAGNDGLTYAANERVLLAGQTTTTQDGIYVVGAVGGGTAPLTRAADWALASVQPAKSRVLIDAGTAWAGHEWVSTLVGATTVGTSSPAFYPKRVKGVTGVMSGTPGTVAVANTWILHATNSIVHMNVKAPGTQGFLSYGTLTAGFGTGAFTITSTANETSTVAYEIINLP